jgi:hypothetical protein
MIVIISLGAGATMKELMRAVAAVNGAKRDLTTDNSFLHLMPLSADQPVATFREWIGEGALKASDTQ